MNNSNQAAAATLRPFLWAGYLLGLVFGIVPLLDRALNWGSVQPGSAAWRFGALGSLSEATLMPVAGLLLLFCVAHLHGSTAVQRSLEIFTGVLAALTLFAITVFVLDAVQMRAAVSGGIARFDRIVLRALGGQILALVFMVLLPLLSVRGRRAASPIVGAGRPASRGAGRLQETLVRPA